MNKKLEKGLRFGGGLFFIGLGVSFIIVMITILEQPQPSSDFSKIMKPIDELMMLLVCIMSIGVGLSLLLGKTDNEKPKLTEVAKK